MLLLSLYLIDLSEFHRFFLKVLFCVPGSHSGCHIAFNSHFSLAPFGYDSFSDFSLFLMMAILKITDRVFL